MNEAGIYSHHFSEAFLFMDFTHVGCICNTLLWFFQSSCWSSLPAREQSAEQQWAGLFCSALHLLQEEEGETVPLPESLRFHKLAVNA